MPEVLYVLSTLAESGPVNQLYNVVSELNDDISVTVLTLSSEPADSRIKDFEPLVESIETLDLRRLESLIKGHWKLRQKVRRIDPDLVHSHGFRADLLSAISIRDISTITTLHTNPRYDYPPKYGTITGRIMAEMHLIAIRAIDEPVACSDSVAKSVGSFAPESNVIRNGVDANTYQPAADKTSCRRALDLPEDKPLFLSVGTFIERKRPKNLIRGYQDSDADGILIVVGKGPLLESCRETAKGSVILPGYVEDVRKYYQAADYYVSASAAEGLPLSVIEALACGLPVALSDIDPHREILSINRDAGILFTGTDITDYARSFEALLAQKYEEASAAARDIITEELNAERMGEQYSLLYRKFTSIA